MGKHHEFILYYIRFLLREMLVNSIYWCHCWDAKLSWMNTRVKIIPLAKESRSLFFSLESSQLQGISQISVDSLYLYFHIDEVTGGSRILYSVYMWANNAFSYGWCWIMTGWLEGMLWTRRLTGRFLFALLTLSSCNRWSWPAAAGSLQSSPSSVFKCLMFRLYAVTWLASANWCAREWFWTGSQ